MWFLNMSGDWQMKWNLKLFEIFHLKHTDAGLFSVLTPESLPLGK